MGIPHPFRIEWNRRKYKYQNDYYVGFLDFGFKVYICDIILGGRMLWVMMGSTPTISHQGAAFPSPSNISYFRGLAINKGYLNIKNCIAGNS